MLASRWDGVHHTAMISMAPFLAEYSMAALLGAGVVLFFAGLTKGTVGFALPMVTISGLGSFLPAELAVAAIILPSIVTNIWQAFRDGFKAALASVGRYALLFAVLAVMIYLSAQLVTMISERWLFMVLGIGVTGFSVIQLSGLRPQVSDQMRVRAEIVAGGVAGFFGGLAGVWGPPIILYLIARGVEKVEQVRVTGLAFLMGSIILTVAHSQTGLLNAQTTPFSAVLILPAMAGMWLGYRIQDRVDQAGFRRMTLIVLVLAGLNLLRRGLI